MDPTTPKDSSPTGSAGETGAGELIEVTLDPPRASPLRLIGALFLAIPAGVLAAVIWFIADAVVRVMIVVAGLAVLVVLIWHYTLKLNVRIETVLRASTNKPLATALHEALPSMQNTDPGAWWKRLAAALAAEGYRNLSIRIRPSQAQPLGEPLDVPFEPLPLQHCDSRFTLTGSDCQASDASDTETDTSPIRQNLRRTIALGGPVLSVFTVVLCSMAIAVFAAASWTSGQLNMGLVLWIVVGVVALLGPGAVGRGWFVVPGGLVLRRSRPWSARWRVHLFDRRRSVLIGFRSGGSWTLWVTDGERSGLATGTQGEIETALRAWLSPLPPPPQERLDDLR